MSWWSRLREFDGKGLLVDRVSGELAFTRKGYCFDRRVFKSYLILVFLVLSLILFFSHAGLKNFYLVCDNYGQPCVNPFYHDDHLISNIKTEILNKNKSPPPRRGTCSQMV